MSIKGALALLVVVLGAFTVYLWGSLSLWQDHAIVLVIPDAVAASTVPVDLSTSSILAAQPYLPPIMQRIAACESTGDPNGIPRQFNSDGSILWGNNSSGTPIKRDCGEFQENQWVWGTTEKGMGLNVCTSQSDNITFALWLHKNFGTSPWVASRQCWQ